MPNGARVPTERGFEADNNRLYGERAVGDALVWTPILRPGEPLGDLLESRCALCWADTPPSGELVVRQLNGLQRARLVVCTDCTEAQFYYSGPWMRTAPITDREDMDDG